MSADEVMATGIPAVVESILFRRLMNNRLLGYTLEASIEISGFIIEEIAKRESRMAGK